MHSLCLSVCFVLYSAGLNAWSWQLLRSPTEVLWCTGSASVFKPGMNPPLQGPHISSAPLPTSRHTGSLSAHPFPSTNLLFLLQNGYKRQAMTMEKHLIKDLSVPYHG